MVSKPSDNLIEQLNKIAKMHADGILSDDEFKTLKTKLIAGISGKQNSGGSTKPANSDSLQHLSVMNETILKQIGLRQRTISGAVGWFFIWWIVSIILFVILQTIPRGFSIWGILLGDSPLAPVYIGAFSILLIWNREKGIAEIALAIIAIVISLLPSSFLGLKSWFRKSAQGDKWSFCLMAGTLCPANQERP